jgi:CO dehydrogenase/acetyl-CoA synthase alpha subunit
VSRWGFSTEDGMVSHVFADGSSAPICKPAQPGEREGLTGKPSSCFLCARCCEHARDRGIPVATFAKKRLWARRAPNTGKWTRACAVQVRDLATKAKAERPGGK